MPDNTDTGRNGNNLRIRMYRVGFGDCFLFSLPTANGPAHILIDCGVHGRGDIHTIEKAVANIAEVTAKKLAVVIATHAHQDHISGFAKCENLFREFEVQEVWLPWTENPKDAQAAKLKSKQAALTQQLAQHFAAAGASEQAMAAVMNLSGNQESLRLLKSGFGNAQVRYMEAGNELTDPAGIRGLQVRVLGPPRDPQFLARMDPPQDQRFLRLNGQDPEVVNAVKPFEKNWQADRNSASPTLDPEDEKALQALAGGPLEGLAFTLDQAMNNTSLVTLFTYRGQNLLFPGDAQYGNWDNWLEQTGSQEILSQLNFYKVAHHGSYNGTPKAALQKMPERAFAAMVSTQSVPWDSIPLPKLMEALSHQAAAVVRSDTIPVPNAPAGPAMAELPSGFTQGDFWFDYQIAI